MGFPLTSALQQRGASCLSEWQCEGQAHRAGASSDVPAEAGDPLMPEAKLTHTSVRGFSNQELVTRHGEGEPEHQLVSWGSDPTV